MISFIKWLDKENIFYEPANMADKRRRGVFVRVVDGDGHHIRGRASKVINHLSRYCPSLAWESRAYYTWLLITTK